MASECVLFNLLAASVFTAGTLKTRDWKTRDLKSMESVTIFKSKSNGAKIKTVYCGMVAMLKASIYIKVWPLQHLALKDEITLIIASE